MSLLPEHESLIELTKQLRELGVTSFRVGETAVQIGPAPVVGALTAAQTAQHIHVSRPTRPPTQDELEAKVAKQRERELSRV